MKPVLTIAIPTFNRPEKLLKQVEAVLPQLREGVELLIVDNCSPYDPAELLAAIPARVEAGSFRIHRNIANIGLAGNLCRCLEVADGEWMWLLGDDDLATPEAVGFLLSAIEEWTVHPAPGPCVGAHFSTGIHRYPKDEVISTSEGYWNHLGEEVHFSNALFLSSCLYQTAEARKHLRIGYMQIGSAAPHIAIYAAAVISGAHLRLDRRFLVEVGQADAGASWNRLMVLAGITTLVDIPGARREILENLGGGIGCLLWRPFLKTTLGLMLTDRDRPLAYWRNVLFRLAIVLRGKRRLSASLLITASWLAVIPGVRPLLARIAGGSGAPVNAGADRI